MLYKEFLQMKKVDLEAAFGDVEYKVLGRTQEKPLIAINRY